MNEYLTQDDIKKKVRILQAKMRKQCKPVKVKYIYGLVRRNYGINLYVKGINLNENVNVVLETPLGI